MNPKFETLIAYLSARASERSTWEGVGFLLTLAGSKWGINLPLDQCVTIGATVSGAIKIIWPDAKAKADIIIQQIHPEVQTALAGKEAS
jgi:hypothetical protein